MAVPPLPRSGEDNSSDPLQSISTNNGYNKDKEDNEEEELTAFSVSQEELSSLRSKLSEEFADDAAYLSDAYLLSVASKPYSKDPTQRRPLDYSLQKLKDVLKWRKAEGAIGLVDLVKLANGSPSSAEAIEQPKGFSKAKALAHSLNYSSTYWHGFTKDGRPILWIRTGRKPWYPNVDAEIDALIVLADAGIHAMPEGVTDFVCVADSAYPPPPNPTYMIKLLQGLVKGYPDRLNTLMSAPVSSIVQTVMGILLPLMPGQLASKVKLMSSDKIKASLSDLLENGEDDIPTFFGGPANHDAFYPEESKCPKRGQGSLKFDYFGMVDRLEASKTAYEARRKGEGSTSNE